MNLRSLLPPLGLIALLAAPCPGQTASQLTSGADFLLVVPGARPAGVGQAFTALADDINALNFNPAGLAQIQSPEIGYDRYQYVSDISYDFIGAAYPLGQPGAVALGFLDSQTQPFNSTPDPNAPLGTYSDMAFLGAYARTVGPFQLGGTLKLILRQIGDAQGTGFLGDLGTRFQVWPGLVLGASMQNIGAIQILNEQSATPTLARLGVAWRCLSSPLHTIDLAMDGDYSLNTQALQLGWGAEYWYQSLFALRAGFVGNSEEEGMAFGAGVKYWGFQLDYAYEPLSVLGDTQRLSLMTWFGPGGDAETPGPVNLQVNPSNDGLLLSWDAPSFVEIQGYRVYIKRPGSETFDLLTAHPQAETSVDLKHMKVGEDYEFAVSTVSATGKESPLRHITAVPEEPQLTAPTGFKAVRDGQEIELTWDPIDPAYVSGFNLYLVDENGTPEKKLPDEPIADNQISLANLRHDQTYHFILIPLSKDGKEGPPSQILAVRYSELPKK